MERIPITNDTREMVAIAKAIVEEKKERYDAGLMNIVKESVRKRLPNANDEEITEKAYVTIYFYWVYGASADEYFYYDFANKTHEQRLEYMTYQLRFIYGAHLNRKDMAHVLNNKYETYELFRDCFMRDVIACRSEDDYAAFSEFTGKHPEFVVKPVDMGGGKGVHKASVAGLSEKEKKAAFLDLLAEGRTNISRYFSGREPSVILEEVIDQDDRIAAFNPESVNGVRLCTLLRGDDVLPFQSWLKIGRGGNFLTSAVFGTMDAGIDPKTGVVNTAGFTETGEVWQRHPDNGLEIPGFQVPRWDELIPLAKECARKVPFFRYVSWDFVLSKKGWCMMEGNFCGDFMWQLYQRRGAKKEFEELIGWKYDREFWWQKD